ncbi:hypothetical protein Tdes44962_MAKER08398 [Teratosphaeria destructans]|uniref:Uncharacterized protein n=1 Tax=Teratosphaeria destructans TaxID=418781 RepID=A0A9W7SWN8_9PEZI|nr:hypothetical protein Tdes44962_MAKER08398 [Teratosphaeria destructans]
MPTTTKDTLLSASVHPSGCGLPEAVRNEESPFNTFPVGRQFYEGSMPCFFGTNNFYFESPDTRSRFVYRTAPVRRQHIRQISYTHYTDAYIKMDTTTACSSLQILASLRPLNISIDEDARLLNGRVKARYGEDLIMKYTNLANIPAIRALQKVRGLKEVNFHGEYAGVEQLLKGNMLKPKVGTKSGMKSCKRKAVRDDGIQAKRIRQPPVEF